MPMDPEVLYRELGQLVADLPRDLSGPAPISAETHRWLGRAATLIAETVGDLNAADMMDHTSFTSAADHLQGVLQEQNAHRIVTILHRALARAERNAPATAQGAFIAVGAAFTVFQVIAKILTTAKTDVRSGRCLCWNQYVHGLCVACPRKSARPTPRGQFFDQAGYASTCNRTLVAAIRRRAPS